MPAGRRPVAGGWFALGAVVAFIGAAAIDVYLLGHVERIKGPDTTFLMFAWLAPVVALVTAAAYVLGAKAWSYRPSARPSLVTGAVISLLFWLSAWLGQLLPNPFSIALAWVVCLGGSFFAARIIRGRGAKDAAPPDS